jgi:hypothetical protein
VDCINGSHCQMSRQVGSLSREAIGLGPVWAPHIVGFARQAVSQAAFHQARFDRLHHGQRTPFPTARGKVKYYFYPTFDRWQPAANVRLCSVEMRP